MVSSLGAPKIAPGGIMRSSKKAIPRPGWNEIELTLNLLLAGQKSAHPIPLVTVRGIRLRDPEGT